MERLSQQPERRQLGFPHSKVIIHWLGTEGLTWDCVRPTAARYSLLDRPPDILVVHAGEDDIGTIPIRDLIRHIRFDLLKLKSLFAGSVVVWSEMVRRPHWPQANTQKGLNRACIKVSKGVSNFLAKNDVVVVRHKKLEDALGMFEKDGVHLNSVGIDIWCMDIQEGINQALYRWQRSQCTPNQGMLPNPDDCLS